MDGAHSKAHTYQKLPTDLLTDAANPMRTCSDAQLLTDLPTDVENYRGIFKNFGAEIN
jgi:hypothetical protein